MKQLFQSAGMVAYRVWHRNSGRKLFVSSIVVLYRNSLPVQTA